MKRILTLTVLVVLSTLGALAQGTAFTYNGKLNDGANPATGNYDLRFTLYNAVTNGSAAGSLTNVSTSITNGLFTATLNFGSVFNGSNYWLELAARTNGSGVFTALSPRQPMLPTPYAIFAASASNATIAASANSVSAANISGTIALAQLPAVVVTNNQSSVTFNGSVTTTNLNSPASQNFTLQAGNGTGNGGNVSILSGNAGVTSGGAGGNLTLLAGYALPQGGSGYSGQGPAGVVNIAAGNGYNGVGGNVTVQSGPNSPWSLSANGYSKVSLQGGTLNAGDGAVVEVEGGHNPLSNGSSVSSGGNVKVTAGNATGGYTGGNIVLMPGTGSPNGNVGIGKNNPATALDVNGTVTATGFSGNGAGLTNLTVATAGTNVALLNGTNTFTGTNTFNNLAGNGGGLTNLNGSQIASGTVADTRLSANVPLLNAANTFSANQTVSGAVGIGVAASAATVLHVISPNANAKILFESSVANGNPTLVVKANSPAGEADIVADRADTGASAALNLLNGGVMEWTLRTPNFTTGEPSRLDLANAASTPVMTFHQSGNVGIGKPTAATALDVNGTVTATGFNGNISGGTNLPLTSLQSGGAANAQILTWSGSRWSPSNAPAGGSGLATSGGFGTNETFYGTTTFNGLMNGTNLSATTGQNLLVAAGKGTGTGGNLTVNAGDAGVTSGGAGGNLNLQAGGALPQGGSGYTGQGAAGVVNVTGGSGYNGVGGNVTVQSGPNSPWSLSANGYSKVSLQGGTLNAGDGAVIDVEGGHNPLSNGSSVSSGGNVKITAGNATGAYSGGNILLLPGNGTPNGNVGIGTMTPSARLHVGGGTRFTVADIGSIFLQSGTGGSGAARDWKMYVPMTAGNLAFRDMGFDNLNNGMTNDALVIQYGTGNVGIGTVNPTTALDVKGTVTAMAFSGNGAGLTNLTVATAGTNVALLNANQTFTGDTTFLRPILVSNSIASAFSAGSVTISAGSQPVSGPGGSVVIQSGAGAAGNLVGDINLTAASVASGVNGNVNITASDNNGGGGNTAGSVNIRAGNQTGAANGGAVSITGGAANGANSNQPGGVAITGGANTGNNPQNGAGANVTIAGGAQTAPATLGPGGSVILRGGISSGSGAHGSIVMQTGAASTTRMTVDQNGNVGIGTNTPVYPLHMASGAYCSAAGVWTSVSDRNVKESFTPVTPTDVLAKLMALPITQWKYKIEPEGIKHLGPVAQDFHAAFGLGDNDRAIGSVDETGVALAAIQGLDQKVEAKGQQSESRIQKLETENAELKSRLEKLEQLFNTQGATK